MRATSLFARDAVLAVIGLIAVMNHTAACGDDLRKPAAVAAEVDRLLEESWNSNDIAPADPADDSAYLRRVYLDLAGRIPAVSELREFLADERPDKRTAIVEQLMDSPAYVRNFTTVWRNTLIPQANMQVEFRGVIPGFEAWLWERIADGRPYDEMVREIITADITPERVSGQALTATTTPDAFFVVRQLKPENLATGTSRVFLGVRLDCAQCHDHPFDKWKQRQFWNLAAFYSGFSTGTAAADNPQMMMFREDASSRSIAIPGTDETAAAIYLTGMSPSWDDPRETTPRELLATWLTDPQNPWFARMAANRMWAQFFGRGIVNPVDDFSDNNPPSHPEVLNLLAEQFAVHDFDLKFLIRTLTSTRAYQLSSRQSHESQADPSAFAKAALRGMTPEQYFDSLAEAVGYYQPYRSENPFVLDTNTPRSMFLELFRDDAESPLDRETTILQALAMMNGRFIDDATSLDESQTLKAIAEFPLMTDDDRLETLFMATVTRRPTVEEHTRFGQYLKSGGATGDSAAALSDIFWALLNSSEFLLNH
ncbi:MAG: DUF1549 and DUF1553 domain-containing protein [Planctomycetaceae bacterium]